MLAPICDPHYHFSGLSVAALTIAGWLDRREPEALAYLIEESRVFR